MKALVLELDSGTWETAVVSAEIFCALAASLWMLHRKVSRDVLVLGGDHHTFLALSPLTQPRGWATLRVLLGYRVLVVAFYLVIQVYDIYRTSGKCMVFYTSWNFILQGAYFICAAKRTYALHTHARNKPTTDYAALLDESSGFLRTHALAGQTRRGWHRLDLVLDVCLSTAVLISVVVWTILLPYANHVGHPEKLLNWVSYCQHGVNLLLLLLDFVATQHAVSLDALPLVVTWPTVYCIFAWVVHGTIKHGFWPYPFLQLDTPWAPVWYGGLLIAHLGSFLGMLLLSTLKRRHGPHQSVAVSSYGDGRPSIEQVPFMGRSSDHDDDQTDNGGSDNEPHSPRASEPHAYF